MPLEPALNNDSSHVNIDWQTEDQICPILLCLPKRFFPCRITNKQALTKGRIHPLRVLLAQATLLKKYLKPSLPPTLLTALDQSFELSFASAKPTGRKFLIAMDVSGSMGSPCLGSDVLTCREATGAIAMILNRIEPDVKV